MSSTLETIRQLRRDALDAKAQIQQRIEETRDRIAEICTQGVVPFDEAWPAYRAAFDSYTEGARKRIENSAAGYVRPGHQNPTKAPSTLLSGYAMLPDVAEPFRVRQNNNGTMSDPGAVIAWLNREAILEVARSHLEEVCAQSNVPPADERKDEISRLASELKALEHERDEIEDELSDLFATDPSQRTKERRRREEEKSRLAAINGPIEERNKRNSPPDPDPNHPFTVRDEDGQDVDDPEHGVAVRSA